MQSCSCLGGLAGSCPALGVTVPRGRAGRGWELLGCSQTHTVHQEPQPTDLCFLCNNQIKVLTETPWLCWLLLGGKTGQEGGNAELGSVTQGWAGGHGAFQRGNTPTAGTKPPAS